MYTWATGGSKHGDTLYALGDWLYIRPETLDHKTLHRLLQLRYWMSLNLVHNKLEGCGVCSNSCVGFTLQNSSLLLEHDPNMDNVHG